MSPRSGCVLGLGLISLGACLLDFAWRRRKGSHNHGV